MRSATAESETAAVFEGVVKVDCPIAQRGPEEMYYRDPPPPLTVTLRLEWRFSALKCVQLKIEMT